jgi:SAM-dependent methyltransferase
MTSVHDLDPEERARRAGSFGSVASRYARYRPGPPPMAVAWYLPERVEHVVDLGAGTGALSRLLVGHAERVSAVEPDDRMRAVLAESLPGVDALRGRGEQLPLPDGCADAVLASSSWHWMDVGPTLREVRRVLKPGGFLGALWSGPDPEGAFASHARTLLSENAARSSVGTMLGDVNRPVPNLVIPPGAGFRRPEHESFAWSVAMTADDLVGLLGTMSWVIDLDEDERAALFDEARRMLEQALGAAGDTTIDVDFRCIAWRADLED